jgi:hypothetical protein
MQSSGLDREDMGSCGVGNVLTHAPKRLARGIRWRVGCPLWGQVLHCRVRFNCAGSLRAWDEHIVTPENNQGVPPKIRIPQA